MGIISSIIERQAFELVRDRIGLILADELADQFYLTGDDDINATVWIERFIPFDSATELPAINVTFLNGEYSNEHQAYTDSLYTFAINVFTKGEGDDSDALSRIRLHKLLGLVRAIIMNPVYKTLNFPAPFIMNRHFNSISVLKHKKDEIYTPSIGTLSLNVRVPEVTRLLNADLIAGVDTNIKLFETEKGYKYAQDF